MQAALPHTSKPAHRIAEASQEAFAFVKANLAERERHVFFLVDDYVKATGYRDVTGGELTAHSGESILSIRPRFVGLCDKGWLVKSRGMRDSRVRGERRCHPVSLNVPRSAVERMR